ncbi:MAG: hypothetical protein QXV32_04980 [Conexivisphaerales archaeon]
MPRPTEEAKAATRNSFLTDLVIQPLQKTIQRGQNLEIRVKFRLRGGIYDAFNREAWQIAWQKHDIMLRLIINVEIFKKGLRSSSLTGKLKFVKKGKLYWTRNPDLTDNITNRIWAFVVDEDSNPRFFDEESKVKEALFDFEKAITIQQEKLAGERAGRKAIFAKAEVRWGRHIFVEKGRVSATSPPVEIEMGKA